MVAAAQTNQIGNRYLLHEPLGHGGMGAVYKATDRLTGRAVALKRVLTDIHDLQLGDTMQQFDFRVALAREFKLSASLRHPNVIQVFDYGFDDEQQPYYTMELLTDPQTILEASQDVEITERIGLVIQMLHALAYLHRRGIIHRDLKPANVLVVENQVKVLDFGLSIMHERAHQETGDSTTAGTLAYMAPEVLMGSGGGVAVDLYAIGMMAFEMIAGEHPFELEEPGLLINQILTEIPDSELLDVSVELSLIIEKLLQKDPQDRYENAQEVIDAFRDATDIAQQTENKAIRESFLQAARLVGRDDELTRLSKSLEQAVTGHSAGWLLAGESGVGKSRIIDEVRTLAMVNGAVVMRGQALNVGSRPYQMWQMALRWLCLLEDNFSEQEIALLKEIISDVDQLLGYDVSEVPALEVDVRTLQSQMVQLLDRIIRGQPRPVVMLFEDLHWAGSESLDVLAQWTKSMNGLPVLVIGSYRDDEQPELYKQLPYLENMKLPRLEQNAIAELSAAMLGDAGRSPAVVDLLQRETEGNVFFVVEVVRALAEEVGNLENIGRMTLPQQVFAGGMQTVIQRRLNRLDNRSQELLQYAAVMGRHLDIELLSKTIQDIDIQEWLSTCSNAAVLEVDDGDWRFAHDKLRVGLLELMSDDVQRDRHQTIAETLETVYGDDSAHIAALAYHWGSAGNVEKEEFYVTIAGEQALRIGAYHEGVTYFSRACKLLDSLDLNKSDKGDKELKLRHLTAEAHLGFGDYETAQEIFIECLNLSEELGDTRNTAKALGSLGEVSFALDAFEEARNFFLRSLELHREVDHKPGIAANLSRLGDVAYELGEQDEAKRLYQESFNLSREIGRDWGMAGAVQIQEESSPGFSTSSSIEILQGVLKAQYKQGDESIFFTLLRIARALQDMNMTEVALQILAFLLHTDTPEEVDDEAEEFVFKIENKLSPEKREVAWETGKNQSIDEIVNIVLEHSNT